MVALRRLIQSESPDVIHTALFESDVLGRLASIGHNAFVVSSLVNTPYDPIRLENNDINPVKLRVVHIDRCLDGPLSDNTLSRRQPGRQEGGG